MAFSAFDDKNQAPSRERLEEVLSGAAGLWKELISGVGSEVGPLAEDWTYSGKKWGWPCASSTRSGRFCT